MIVINGKVFTGNNISIINGRVVGDTGRSGKTQQYDETRREDSTNIDRISINTETIDVSLTPSDASEIVARMHGAAEHDGSVNFDFRTVNRELMITLDFSGSFFDGKLNLDISVPRKTFKVISMTTKTGDLTLAEGVSAESLKVKTQTGDVESEASLNDISIDTQTGDVDLCINATTDIHFDVNTQTGDVSTTFKNISLLYITTKSTLGDVKNCHAPTPYGHSATGRIRSQTGDIRVR